MFENKIKIVTGFTLLEVMLASWLGSTVFLGLFYYYSLIIQLNFSIQVLANKIESGRYALFFLWHHLHDIENDETCAKNFFPIFGRYDQVSYRNLQATKGSDILETMHCKNNRLTKTFFYIAAIKDKDDLASKHALFLKKHNEPALEIARGIDKMQVFYGVKCISSNNVCYYLPADKISDWARVGILKIKLIQIESSGTSKSWRIAIAIKPNKR